MRMVLFQDHLRHGGTERQTVRLATAWAQAGEEVTVLTTRPGGALWPRGKVPFTLRALQPFDTGSDLFAPGLGKALREIAPEAIVCMGRVANLYGGHLRRRYPQASLVLTVRTGKRLPWAYRRALLQADLVCANSSWWRHRLQREFGLPPERTALVPNALAFAPLGEGDAAAERERLRGEHGVAADELVLLQVAGLRKGKRHAWLLEQLAAWQAPVPWRLWLVGSGAEEKRLRRQADRLDLAGRVHFVGARSDPRPFYAAADVALTASAEESLPNFVIEAQAHGLPVVAADVAGTAEAFLDGVTGTLVPPGDAPAFHAALAHWAEQPQRRHEAAGRARAFARERFDPARQTAAFLDLVRAAVRARSAD